MPIDGHAYLVSQGWSGKGSGLRHGAISRPIAVTQKKTLSGIGKDRDEAFPFWDHVFSAAASRIAIAVDNSEDESDQAEIPTTSEVVSFVRTKTGIISNRRPTAGTPIDSGSTTPNNSGSGSSTPRLSIMAAAKQEAARRMLYSMFFRGPVMTSKDEDMNVADGDGGVLVTESVQGAEAKSRKSRKQKGKEREVAPEYNCENEERGKKKKGKMDQVESSEERRERKRRKHGENADSGESDHGAGERAKKKARKEEKRRLKAERKEAVEFGQDGNLSEVTRPADAQDAAPTLHDEGSTQEAKKSKELQVPKQDASEVKRKKKRKKHEGLS